MVIVCPGQRLADAGEGHEAGPGTYMRPSDGAIYASIQGTQFVQNLPSVGG